MSGPHPAAHPGPPPAQAAATPGQAACEAYGSDRWANVGPSGRACWEAAAQAAIALGRLADPAREKVTIERDGYRQALEAIAASDGTCGAKAREALGGDHA